MEVYNNIRDGILLDPTVNITSIAFFKNILYSNNGKYIYIYGFSGLPNKALRAGEFYAATFFSFFYLIRKSKLDRNFLLLRMIPRRFTFNPEIPVALFPSRSSPRD